MGNKKDSKVYNPKAFEFFGRYLINLRRQGAKKFLETKVNLDGLTKAMKVLAKEDREIIERF